MAFGRKWPIEVERALVAEVLAGGRVPAVHARALAGEVVGVRPEDVPPVGTLRYWATVARRELAAQDAASTGAVGIAERIAGKVAQALERHADRARSDPDQLARVARATTELVKLRTALDRANADGKRDRGPARNADGDAAPGGFLAELAAEQ